MSTTEQAKNILETLRAELKQEKEAIVALLKDPKIADWQAIDLKRHQPLFDNLGIDGLTLERARERYPEQAKAIGRQIVVWGNEIGNHMADLMDCQNPDVALTHAQELAERCRLAGLKEELQASIDCLLSAHLKLRQQLDIKSILNVARALGLGKKDLYPEGMATLLLLTPDAGEGGGLNELRREPGQLEARFQHLDVTRMPRLAEEIIFQHIEAAMALCREIGHYLDTVTERLLREIEAIAALEKGLAALRPENPARLVAGMVHQADFASNLISALYHKRQLKETLSTVVEALDCLRTLHLLLKTKILPDLQQETTVTGAAINPTTIAGRMTHSFFLGAQGIIRSFKLMLGSLAGKSGINEIELQLLLEQAIQHCKTFHGTSQGELKALQNYIDGLINQYQKPFPYNELSRLVKRAISAYGEVVEKFIQDYEVPQDLSGHRQAARVGLLLDAIARHRAVFQKANAEAM